MRSKSVLNAEKVKYFTSNVPRAKILSDLKRKRKKKEFHRPPNSSWAVTNELISEMANKLFKMFISGG